MSKLYRSMLWSGLVVAGVAACGDDVSVVNPPPPVATVHSISVAPNGVTVGIGANVITMSAAVNADAGVTNLAVTWSTSDAIKATVSQTGQVTTLQTGSVAIIACSVLVPSVCGNATLTISTTAPTATSVTVVPGAATIIKGSTLQLVASVQGLNNPSQTVTWLASPNPAVATVNATTGLVTAVNPGTVPITGCSTIAGFTTVCGSSAITVALTTPASASISNITWVPPTGPTVCTQGPGPVVPVILTGVRCQIEVTANVNGGDQALSRLDVVFTNAALGTSIVVASQTFPGTAPVDGGDQSVSAPVDITMSINTQMLRRPGGAGTPFIPAIFNGNTTVSLNLYVVGATSPLIFDPRPIVMNNTDAILAPVTMVATTLTPSFTTGGVTWFKGTVTVTGAQYISFSTVAPTSVTLGSALCGSSVAGASVSGTPATGLPLTNVFSCAGVEGSLALNGLFTVVTPTLVGPDGTVVTVPTVFSGIGSAFTLPANNVTGTPPDQRWNLITPIPALVLPAAIAIDNKAPTPAVQAGAVGVGPAVAFNDAFDQQWVNATYLFAQDISATEFGSGLATLIARDYSPGVFVPVTAGCTTQQKITPGPLVGFDPLTGYPETLTSDGSPDGFRICAFATDNLGNSAASGPSNWFGVDKVSPSSRLAGTTAATPLIAPLTAATVSAIPNTTIYGDGAGPLSGTLPVMPPTDAWGLESQDTRSGFNQNVVAGFPANQTLSRLAVGFVPAPPANACPTFTNAMNTVLSDTWVRTNVLVNPVDCGFGIGYYNYNGTVTDRAGNQATPIVRNFAQDHLAAPSLASIGASVPLYTAGAAAPFFVFGSDDLEIIEGDITVSYPNLGIITATIEGITYPLAQINGTNPGVRWDNLLNNIVTAGTITVPNLLGRVDFTCTGAGTPYAGCLVAGGLPAAAVAFNTINATNDGQSPDSVRAVAYDVASNASLPVASGLLSIQTTDVAQQWIGADLINWRVCSTAGGGAPDPCTVAGTQVVARHTASTSITAPFFDSVLLGRADVANTEIRVCGTFPAPALTDNGVNRFWTYALTKPTGSQTCATGGAWYAIGLKTAAALVTQAVP